jgi:hypothetical protein
MLSNISTLGWIIIIGLAVFILVLNLSLFFGIKRKMEKDNWIDKLSAAGDVLRHPMQKENDLYQELSEQVAKIKSGSTEIENDERR